MKHIYLLLAMVMTCFLSKAETTVATEYAGGNGTSDNPYQIETLAQLRLLSETSDDWSKYFILTDDIDAEDTENWNEEAGFSPIGNTTTYFTGSFKGKNHSISNLFINTSNARMGLFGAVSAGTIDSLAIINCDISGANYVGALAGIIDASSTVSYCYSTGAISGSNYVGGLLGSNSNSEVSYCYSCATAEGNNLYIGGLVGANNDNSKISYSFGTGSVSGKYYCGGLAGHNNAYSKISYCYSTGSVSGTGNSGGLVGGNYSAYINNSYYDSETSGNALGIGYDNNNQNVNILTTAEFKDVSEFTNWDFGNTWVMYKQTSIDDNVRPYFKNWYDHVVTFSYNENRGSITGPSVQGVNDGESAIEVTAVAKYSYFIEWQYSDGNQYSTDSTLTLTNVTEDITLTAVFEVYTYNLKFSSDENGSISGAAEQTIEYGLDATEISAIPATGGVRFVEWQDADGNQYSTENPLTITDVTGDIDLTAKFTKRYADGYGTSDEPFQISTLDELENLSENSSDWDLSFILTSDIDASDTKNWNDEKGFSPIGGSTTKFTGIFNGNNHIISNLYISRSSTQYVGLFGNVDAATIKNAGVVDAIINGYWYMSPICGYASNSSVIEQCFSTATCSGSYYLGGIVGYSQSSTISNCFTKCSLKGRASVAGIAGRATYSQITNCYSASSCSTTIINYPYRGAIIGAGTGTTVTCCYWDSSVFGDTPTNTSGTELSTDDFAAEDNFSDWDFESTWKVLAHASIDEVSRPYLQWTYDHVVSYELKDYGDSIVGAALQGVKNGSNAYEVKALGEDGYILKEWQDAEGDVVNTENPLTMTNVTMDSTLYAIFYAGYKVEFTSDENGSVSGSEFQEITSGSDASEVTAVPNTGYHFDEWHSSKGDSITNDNPLTVLNVSQDSILTAIFEPDTFAIVFNVSDNGTITGTSSQEIAYTSASEAVTAVPSTGYYLLKWINTDGDSITNDNPLTISNVTQDSTLTAVFDIISCSLSFSADDNGSVSGETSQTVDYGSDATEMTATPNTGYYFSEWQDADGNQYSTENPLTIENVTSDITLTAVFEIYTYSVKFTADDNGTISENADQTVDYGSDALEVTASAATDGYDFVEWQDADGNQFSTENPLTITNVTEEISLTAIFEKLYADGSGTSDAPFQIESLEQLQNLSETSSSWDKYFILTADIDASDTKNWNDGEGFSPIGNGTTDFTGSFNGQSHIIDGLYINRSENDSIGLFGFANNAEIDSLGLTNCDITGSTVIGALSGVIKNCEITNCYATGEVSGGLRTAGFVGLTDTSSVVSYCYSECNVSSTGNGTAGFTGATIKATLLNCYATGNVTSTGSTIGGLVAGGNSSTINNCYVTGAVSGKTYVGAFLGSCNNITVNNSYSTGHVSGSSSIGAFIGYCIAGTFNNCYYDYETIGRSNSVGTSLTSVSITSLTTSQFADESNFSNWDFDSTWKNLALANVDSIKRPQLQWSYDYVVTFEVGENGQSVTGGDIQGVNEGESTLEVTAVPNTGYDFIEWQDADGNTVSTENPLTLTNITEDKTIYATFAISTGIPDNTTSSFKLYPNPTTGLVNIDLEDEVGNAELSVYSITGTLVYSNRSFNGETVDLSELNNGIYIIKIKATGKSYVARLIKE